MNVESNPVRRLWQFALLAALGSCATAPPRTGPDLRIAWEKNFLTIAAEGVPEIRVWYLEAYVGAKSTRRKWQPIPHKTEKTGESPGEIRLRCTVEGGVEVAHRIAAGRGEVSFEVEAVNRGPAYVDAVWVQPCVRLDKFTGAGKETYIPQCFIYVDGRQTFLDKARRTEEAIYKGGQVYVPAGIDREDVNPRPLSPDVPSNGLIGCVSADRKWLFATAWEPCQELFQGVITCLHSDFRLGGLKPGETKKARGKIYVLENDPDRLVARYRSDFP